MEDDDSDAVSLSGEQEVLLYNMIHHEKNSWSDSSLLVNEINGCRGLSTGSNSKKLNVEIYESISQILSGVNDNNIENPKFNSNSKSLEYVNNNKNELDNNKDQSCSSSSKETSFNTEELNNLRALDQPKGKNKKVKNLKRKRKSKKSCADSKSLITPTKKSKSAIGSEIINLISDSESSDSVVELERPIVVPPEVVDLTSDESVTSIDASNQKVAPKEFTSEESSFQDEKAKEKSDVEILARQLSLEIAEGNLEINLPAKNNVNLSDRETSVDYCCERSNQNENNTIEKLTINISTVNNIRTFPNRSEFIKKNENGKKRKKQIKKVNEQKYEEFNLATVNNNWSPEMVKFYNHSWGGENFDHSKIIANMPANPENWKIGFADLYGSNVTPLSKLCCFNCNRRGHLASRCPFPLKPLCCSMCGQRGHMVQTCPNKLCLRCGNPAQSFGNACIMCVAIQCVTCGGRDHFVWQCPSAWRPLHSTRNGSEPQSAIVYKNRNNMSCYFCAGRGHFPEECQLRLHCSVSMPGYRLNRQQPNLFEVYKRTRNSPFRKPQIQTGKNKLCDKVQKRSRKRRRKPKKQQSL